MATKWQTQWNFKPARMYKTKITMPSETEPNQALTIPEIIKRFQSGRSVNVPIYDEYTGDEKHLTGIDVRTLDMSVVHDMVENAKNSAATLQDEINRRQKEKADALLEESIIAKFKARQAPKDDEKKSPYIQTSILPTDEKL